MVLNDYNRLYEMVEKEAGEKRTVNGSKRHREEGWRGKNMRAREKGNTF